MTPTKSLTERLREVAKTATPAEAHGYPMVLANAQIVTEAAARIEELEAALREIATHRAISYENSGAGQYGIGVADGHRLCASIARRALSPETRPPAETGETTT